MKTITLSHYTMKDINPAPWRQTWDNLVHFASRMAPKLAPLGFQLKLRRAELEELTQDNLMTANMVTIACPENDTPETPIENLLMLEEVIKAVARQRGRNDADVFRKVKTNVIREFNKELKQQALQHTRHYVKRTIEVVVDRRFQNITALEDHLEGLVDDIRPRTVYDQLCRKFNEYVQHDDYRSILRVYNQKSMCGDSNVAQLCGFDNKDAYVREVFNILKRNNANADAIRKAIKACFDMTPPGEKPKKKK